MSASPEEKARRRKRMSRKAKAAQRKTFVRQQREKRYS